MGSRGFYRRGEGETRAFNALAIASRLLWFCRMPSTKAILQEGTKATEMGRAIEFGLCYLRYLL
jgi:hypothetical protein